MMLICQFQIIDLNPKIRVKDSGFLRIYKWSPPQESITARLSPIFVGPLRSEFRFNLARVFFCQQKRPGDDHPAAIRCESDYIGKRMPGSLGTLLSIFLLASSTTALPLKKLSNCEASAGFTFFNRSWTFFASFLFPVR